MEILIVAGVVIVVLFLNAFVTTPPYHFDVLSVLGRRVRNKKGILREGPHLVPPLISARERVSMELVKKDIEFEFTTKDKLKLKISGVFQYRPDPDVMHPAGHQDAGRNVFVTVSEDVIVAGVVEAVEARIGGVGGTHDHTVFIENRPSLGDIVNAILRFDRPPHIMHQKGSDAPDPANMHSWANHSWTFCGRPNCPYDGPIDADKLIDFYKFHWPEIRTIKANEKKLNDSRSEIELRYGIDVESFDLGNVAFTKETEEALEEEQQSHARAKAADKRLETAKRWRDEIGVSPQTAADQADMIMDPTVKKTIVSVQGEGGVLAGALGALAKKVSE